MPRKGHNILLDYQEQFVHDLSTLKIVDPLFVEIGSQRGAGSTFALAKLAKELGMKFVTVDIDKQISDDAELVVKGIDKSFEAVNMDGVKYLRGCENAFIVYLDAFDFWHPNHPKERIQSYLSRGTKLTDGNCWKMHCNCAKALVKNMPLGGYVCFDDVLTGPPNWKGKGKTAIPLLLKNGFCLLAHEKCKAAIFKRESVNDDSGE